MEKKTVKPTASDGRVYVGARIEKDTKRQLEAKAKWSRRSLSGEIDLALQFWVKK